MLLTETNSPAFVCVLAILAILLGLAGRRSTGVRIVLCGLAPIASAVPFSYFLFEASVPARTGGAFAHCGQVPYTSTWGRSHGW